MKLNPDIIRGILLTVEENCDFDHVWEYQRDSFESVHLAERTHDEIIYHIRQCNQSGLITGVHYYDGGKDVIITDLTPEGHEFLNNIRNESIWKDTMKKGAGASLPIIIELAKQIATKYFLG